MNIYQLTRSYFALFGIYSVQFDQKYPINKQNIKPLIVFSVAIIFSIIFLLYEANNIEQYTNTFYASATVILNYSYTILHIRKTKKLYKFMSYFECVIHKSKCNSTDCIHRNSNHKRIF